MWIQFAPPAVRWFTFACFVILVLAMLAMPKEERRRMFAGARRRRTSRPPPPSPSATPWVPLDDGDANITGESPGPFLESSRSLRTLGLVAGAARFVLAAAAVLIVILVVWMAIAFLVNLPGWR